MKLTPINNETKTKLFTTEHKKITKKHFAKSSDTDPLKIIPSGMYSIIASYRKDLLAAIILFSIIFAGLTVMVISFATIVHIGWIAYIVPLALFTICIYKWIILLIQYNSFNKWVDRYREDIQYELTSVPQFLDTIYIGLIKKQVAHNWISFISIFYISIFTLLLWGLKDQSWGFLTFNTWILYAFKEPTLITTLLTASIFFISFIHIYAAIRRKQQLYRIDAFIGHRIISGAETVEMKATLNKAWRRGFILSCIIILVIPLIIKLILKLLSKR